MISISKKIELLANIAIIVVACLLAAVVIKNYLRAKPSGESTVSESRIFDSQKLSILNIDWRQSNQTLLLAISNSCHFCTESASFYKQLAHVKGRTRLIAVLPQPINEGKKYLDGLGVVVDDIKQSPLPSIDVSGTPTLILVNHDGTVMRTWIGKLPQHQEKEVLGLL